MMYDPLLCVPEKSLWGTVVCTCLVLQSHRSHSLTHSLNQSISQSVSQSVNQSFMMINQSTNQSVGQSVNISVSQSINHSWWSINQPVSQSVDQSVNHRSVSQSVSQSISQSASQTVSQPDSQSVSQSDSQSVGQSVSQSLVSQSIRVTIWIIEVHVLSRLFLTCLLWYLLYTQEHFHQQNQQPSVSGSPSVPDMTPVNYINKPLQKFASILTTLRQNLLFLSSSKLLSGYRCQQNRTIIYKIWSLWSFSEWHNIVYCL